MLDGDLVKYVGSLLDEADLNMSLQVIVRKGRSLSGRNVQLIFFPISSIDNEPFFGRKIPPKFC